MASDSKAERDMPQLSHQAMADLCSLASHRCFAAAHSVAQLVDDPAQKIALMLTLAEMMLAASAKLTSNATNQSYEFLIKDLSSQLAERALEDQPPTDWLNDWIKTARSSQ